MAGDALERRRHDDPLGNGVGGGAVGQEVLPGATAVRTTRLASSTEMRATPGSAARRRRCRARPDRLLLRHGADDGDRRGIQRLGAGAGAGAEAGRGRTARRGGQGGRMAFKPDSFVAAEGPAAPGQGWWISSKAETFMG